MSLQYSTVALGYVKIPEITIFALFSHCFIWNPFQQCLTLSCRTENSAPYVSSLAPDILVHCHRCSLNADLHGHGELLRSVRVPLRGQGAPDLRRPLRVSYTYNEKDIQSTDHSNTEVRYSILDKILMNVLTKKY